MGAAMPMPECDEAVEQVEAQNEPAVKEKRKEINSVQLRDWLKSDTIKDHYKNEQFHIAGNYYRINVWTRTKRPDMLFDDFKIPFSYFVEYKDGVITDKTIKKPVGVPALF